MVDKKINQLLDLMAILHNAISEEIREVNRGKGHAKEEIENTLKYWIEDRMFFYENQN